jgi:heme exporter protein C
MTWIPLGLLAVVATLGALQRFRWGPPALLAVTALLFVSGNWLGLAWAPADQYMGDVSRIMFVHVPEVWMAMLAVAVTFGASLGFLLTGSLRADAVAVAAAEVGLFFGSVGVALGSLWGHTTWGVWWSWDPRLTATVGMLVLLAASLLLRLLGKTDFQRATWGAAVGCLVAVALPVVWFSVRWWSSLHQMPSTPETMDPAITLTLRWNTVAFFGLFLLLVHRGVRLRVPPADGAQA